MEAITIYDSNYHQGGDFILGANVFREGGGK